MRIVISSTSHTPTLELFFKSTAHTAFSGSFMKSYTVTADGNVRYYTIPLSGDHPAGVGTTDPDQQLKAIPGWTDGTVSQLRVDPSRSSIGWVEYSDIFIRQDDKAPTAPVVDTSSMDWATGTISLTLHGDDPPPVNGSGANPDLYASGVYDFGWSIDGGPEYWEKNSGYDFFTGTAGVTLSFPGTPNAPTLAPGCHTLQVRCRDRCGWTGPYLVRTLRVGPPPMLRISGYSTSYETGLPVAGDRITYGELCGPVTGYVTTDASGYYQTPPLPVGSYSLGAGSCDDVAYLCGNPLVLDCGDQTASFRQKGLVTVAGLTATGGTDAQSIVVRWNTGTQNTASYNLYSASSSSGPWTLVYSGQPPYTRAGLSCGDGAYFRVAAVNACSREGAPCAAVFGRNDHCLLQPVVTAPGYGATIGLPEVFSWERVGAAASYDVQIAGSGGFGTVLWSTTTSLTSVTVPASALPSSGAYQWRVRALAPGLPPGEWCGPQTFVRVATTNPPGGVTLLSPENDGTSSSSSVLLQWAAAANATSYRLEVSTSPTFDPGASLSWSADGIPATSSVVNLSPAITQVYWRVSAANSAGLGPPSGARLLNVASASAGLSAASILQPSQDFAVGQGDAVSASALLVGHTTAAITVDWLFDGALLLTQSVVLSGTGTETDPVAIPTTDLGTHTIEMHASDGTTEINGPTRYMDVVAPGFGPPVRVVVVPDSADLVSSGTTTLYCTVRDANGSIVLGDNGRPLHVSTAAGAGTVAPPDITVSGGIAVTALTAGTTDAVDDVVVDAAFSSLQAKRFSALAVSQDRASYSVSSTEFKRQKQIAGGYIARLSALTWDGVDGAFGSTPNFSFHLQGVTDFVNALGPSDLPKLQRLNLILRLYDRSFAHDDTYQRTTPREPKVSGIATLWVDATRTMASVALCAFDLKESLYGRAKKLPILGAGLRWLANLFVDTVDRIVRWGLNHYKGPASERDLMQQMWDRLVAMVQTQVKAHPTDTIDKMLLSQLDIVGGVAAPIPIKANYIDVLQGKLAETVSVLRSPSWTGGSAADAESYANWVIGQVRGASNHEHSEYKATADAFSSTFVRTCQDLAVVANPTYGTAAMAAVEGLIKGAQGIDCAHVALDITSFLASATTVLEQPVSAAQLAATRTHGLNALAAAPSSQTGQRRILTANPAVMRLTQQAGTTEMSLEAAIGDVAVALRARDTAAVAGALTSLATLEGVTTDNGYGITAPLFATLPAARLDVAGFDANADSVASSLEAAARLRFDGRAATWSWLEEPNNDSLQAAALAAWQLASDQSHTAVEQAVNSVPTVLGEPGDGQLAIGTPVATGSNMQGDVITLACPVMNYGAAEATTAQLILHGPSEATVFVSDSVATIGPLSPGQGDVATWRVRLYPAIADTDTVANVILTVSPDSGSTAGMGRLVAIDVQKNPTLVAVPPAEPAATSFRLVPNPAHGRVAVLFSLARPGRATVAIFDVAGRRVSQWRSQALGAGVHSWSWNAKLVNGSDAPPGIYLVHLVIPGLEETRRAIVVR